MPSTLKIIFQDANMDLNRFIVKLPDQFKNWDQDQTQPLSGQSEQFEQIISQIGGMTTPNVLQLLSFGVSCLDPTEVYCEIGVFRGATLVGSLLEHPNQFGYAVDDFSESDAFGENLDRLSQSLTAYKLEDRICFCQQDFEEFFADLRRNEVEDKIGLYVYDAAHDYRSQLLGLLLAIPFLAEQALIVVLNGQFESASQAVYDFIASHPQSKLLLDFSKQQSWQGTYVIGWNAITDSSYVSPELEPVRRPAAIASISSFYTEDRQKSLNAIHDEAITLHHRDRFSPAEQLYKHFLLWCPESAIGWLSLAKLYYAEAQSEKCLEALHRSLALNAEFADIHYTFGQVFERIGDLDQAIAAYQQAIALGPKHIDSFNNLANIFAASGQYEQAAHLLQRALLVAPTHAGICLNLGNALFQQGDTEAAIDAYEKALKLQPYTPDILHNLAIAYDKKGDSAEALDYLAHAFFREQKYEEAISAFYKLLQLKEGEPYIYLNLSDCLANTNQEEESLEILHTGLRVHPESSHLYARIIAVLFRCSRNAEALGTAQELAQNHPDNLGMYFEYQLMVPVLYESQAEIAEWRQRFTEGLQNVIKATRLDTEEERKKAFNTVSKRVNFFLYYQAGNDLELQSQYGQLIHTIVSANYHQYAKPLAMLPIDGKIRIGYVSHHFSNHAGTRWAEGWFKHTDRRKFEVYAYYTGTRIDGFTQAFKSYFDRFFHIITGLEDTCRKILSDQLHILIHLDIGMDPFISTIAALRLAPVQGTTWGHPITSGIPTIDYFISGDLVQPDNAQDHYSENLIRLPKIGMCFPTPFIPENTKTRAEFGFSDNHAIYLCCQSWSKYLPKYDYLLAGIAKRVPLAKLIFVAPSFVPNASMQVKLLTRLQPHFDRFGLQASDFCVFLPRQDSAGYYGLLQCADVFLDTLDFSGGYTTLEAIACNLPIVTMPGEFMRGRQSYGFLTMLGVTDTIAKSEAEYIEIAVRLGLDSEWRQEISQRMGDRHHYLYEDTECVRGLEDFYQRVVQEKLENQVESQILSGQAIQIESQQKLVLHVGCGPYRAENLHETFRNDEWKEVRFDIDPSVYPDIIGSLTDMSAVANESVDAIWSSHNVEHLYHHEVPIALAEFYRVLKQEGLLLVTVPDIQQVAEHVATGNLEEPLYISPAGPIAAVDILYGLGTSIANGNHYMAHRTAFTSDTLYAKLLEAGFMNVEVWKGNNLDLWAKAYK
jgi:protein O-GlcNAc transferase